jgi:hypothetical protein
MVNNKTILDNNTLLEKINTSINKKVPSSFIRKGDGENIVIGYKNIRDIKFKDFYRMMRIMNISLINLNFHKFIQEDLINSFNNCDIMGISKKNQRYGHWAIEDEIINLLNFNSNQFCDMNFHMEFVKYPKSNQIKNKLAKKILSNKSIGVISCFDVSEFLHQYNTNIKKWIKMPIQRDNFFNKKIDMNFYNKAYNEIANNSVDVWIVAAGIHAKIFCNQIKVNGGIAVDIGSSIDSWKNIYSSRGYLKNIYKNN